MAVKGVAHAPGIEDPDVLVDLQGLPQVRGLARSEATRISEPRLDVVPANSGVWESAPWAPALA